MAGKKGKSEGAKKLQKTRTYKNQARRYRSLVEQFPTHKDKPKWETKAEFYEKTVV